MDTLKDKQWLETLHESGAAPWQVWVPEPGLQAAADPAGRHRLMLPLALGRSERRSAPDARDRRSSGRHRDRLRRDDPQAHRGGCAFGRSAGWCSAARASAPRRRGRAPRRCWPGWGEKRARSSATFATASFPTTGARSRSSSRRSRRSSRRTWCFTHQRTDLHQDHRVTCELTWNTFRDHLDPRVRGAQVRRRHGRAERLRAARARISAAARSIT